MHEKQNQHTWATVGTFLENAGSEWLWGLEFPNLCPTSLTGDDSLKCVTYWDL